MPLTRHAMTINIAHDSPWFRRAASHEPRDPTKRKAYLQNVLSEQKGNQLQREPSSSLSIFKNPISFPRSVRKGECANHDRRESRRGTIEEIGGSRQDQGKGSPAAISSRANTFYCNFRVVIVTSNERAVWSMLSRDRPAIQERQNEDALYRAARAMTVSVLRMRKRGWCEGCFVGEGWKKIREFRKRRWYSADR